MIDRIDKHILSLLQNDCSISNQELADKVALSPSPCLRRVKHLEENNIITKRVALLNPEPLGLALTVHVLVGLSNHSPNIMQQFEEIMSSAPEVITCQLITGQSADYVLKVIIPDLNHYQAFLLEKLTRIKGVSSVQSSFVLRNIVAKTSLPLDHIET